MKYFLIILLFTALLTSAVTSQEKSDGTLTKIGQDVPEFKVTTLDEKNIEIAKLQGKVVLINFFATWCAPCMAEMPHLEEEILKKYQQDDFVVIAIGREHSKEELSKFNQEKKFSFKIAPDPKREVYSKFAEKFIPRNYLINREGKIVFQSIGFEKKEFEELINKIDGLLKK